MRTPLAAALLFGTATACSPAPLPTTPPAPAAPSVPASAPPPPAASASGAAEPPGPPPARAKDLALGSPRSCAVLEDGGVSCWSGRGGAKPTRLAAVADVVSVASGLHVLLARADGSVVAFRQQGDVVPLSKVSDAAEVSSSYLKACARQTSGKVACWRPSVLDGEDKETAPSPVLGVSDAIDIDSGEYYVCAARKNGAVACAYLGGAAGVSPRFTPVPGISDAESVVVAMNSGCARTAKGVRCFSLGRIPATKRDFPPADAVAIHQSGPDESALVCLSRGATVSCERIEDFGSGHVLPTLATGSTELPGVTRVARLALVNHAACALDQAGSVACWGHNLDSVLGQPDPRHLDAATRVPGVPAVRSLGVGERFTCALTRSGEVWCWGYAAWAGKGGGGKDEAPPDARAKRVEGLSGMKRLIVSESYACAFDASDHAHCFFGVEGPESPRRAYRVAALDGVRSALFPDMGVRGTCLAIGKQGELLFGKNPGFQSLEQLSLAPVAGFEQVKRLSRTYSQFLIQKADGSVHFAWSGMDDKQLAPVAIPALDGALDLAGTHFALFAGGRIAHISTDEKKAPELLASSPLVSLFRGDGPCGLTKTGEARCLAAPGMSAKDVTLFDKVVAVAGDLRGTQCALDATGHVLCRGACDSGQCGVTQGVRETKVPLRVPLTR